MNSRVHEIDNDWKPEFLLNEEFTHIILEVNFMFNYCCLNYILLFHYCLGFGWVHYSIYIIRKNPPCFRNCHCSSWLSSGTIFNHYCYTYYVIMLYNIFVVLIKLCFFRKPWKIYQYLK